MTTLAAERAGNPAIAIGAWSLVAGGLLMVILGVPLAAMQNATPFPWPIAALNAVSHLLLVVGIAALAISGAAPGRLGRAGIVVTIVGLLTLTAAEGIAVVTMDVAVILYSLATLLMIVGLILAGIATLRGRWSGWHRFTPLLCGLFLLLVVFPALMMPGFAGNYALGMWGVCWLLLGLALRQEAEIR